MTAPNRSTLWGTVLVDELAAAGLEAVCIAPGSRSTPLTYAFAEHDEVTVYSHLDERSAAFFALGRARRTGEPTALVCTSGTAAANFHPAVIEADQGRVPLLVLTADRPAELRDSGANQTIDQVSLYGDAVRWHVELPAPAAEQRRVRSLRTTACRALAKTTDDTPGPVHLNCPFPKPLEPLERPGEVPESFGETVAGRGRDGPFVETTAGRTEPTGETVTELAGALRSAERPLLVAGPADPLDRLNVDPATVSTLAERLGAPLFADPLSGLRFGPHLRENGERRVVMGGYDVYADLVPAPDLVVRIGASPTSKRLRQALRDADARQILVDSAGEWREATFTATDLVGAPPAAVLDGVLEQIPAGADGRTSEPAWLGTVSAAERAHWATAGDAQRDGPSFEGSVVATALAAAPDRATVFVSNSMPIREADRFGQPRRAALTVLGNRGASGIDGITSTALGAGSGTDEPLVLVTGDLAFYHDSNGLLALERCGVDATIVLIDNDGGGIFHNLPIADFDPPFTEQFQTPHGLDFEPLADLYGFEFETVEPANFEGAYRDSIERSGTQCIRVAFDAAESHNQRDDLERTVRRNIENVVLE